jgi:predicted nucleotidyltransferase component of viral defense system
MELTNVQTIEFLHVAFLDVLSARLDPQRYVLKGGANLRYFFASQRYSEDIDLDFIRPVPWSIKEKVDGVLESPALRGLLAVGGLSLEEWSSSKQTDTTHRWKVGVRAPSHSQLVRTKIEFSNRESGGECRLDPVPAAIVEPYALRRPTVQHYTAAAATEQKVLALVGRTQTQARDVFDLELLLRRNSIPKGSLESDLLDVAIDRALELTYDAFRDQVLAFLDPGAVELYDSAPAWEQLQTFVAERLEAAK